MTQINVSITQNYRLLVDDAQYTLYERHTVDPTKAPGYKSDGTAPALREEWRSMKRHYPLNDAGLFAALKYVAIIVSHESLAERDGVTVADLLAEYTKETARLNAHITSALIPHQLGAPVASE